MTRWNSALTSSGSDANRLKSWMQGRLLIHSLVYSLRPKNLDYSLDLMRRVDCDIHVLYTQSDIGDACDW